MSSTTSTISTAKAGAACTIQETPRRRGRLRPITTVIRALAAPMRPSPPVTPAPSNRWLAPISRDYALDPAYHLRMVR